MMEKWFFTFIGILLIIFVFVFFNSPKFIYADCVFVESEDLGVLEKAKDECSKEYDARMPAQNKNKEDLAKLEKNLEITKKLIQAIELQVKNLEKEIFAQEIELEYQKEIFAARVRDYYKKSKEYSMFSLLLTSSSANDLFRELSYRQSAAENDKKIIIEASQDLKKLNDNRTKLEANNLKLNSAKAKLDQDTKALKAEVDKVDVYFSQVNQTIAALSARQQEIINARSGSFIASIGDTELADDYNASIKGFRESAPSGYFAVFSFGAFTHRNGMSQYGALGRVKNNGWDYEQILKYYYPGVQITKVDINKTITVYGTNSYGQSFNNENYQLEEYLKHIYEVPASWPAKVLKAQAIAARSYAYGKGRICSGQGCQEFKREENSVTWKQAVKDTEGLIMTGGPGSYQYSSTTGGWINGGVGWDTTDGSGGSNFIDKSYEKAAGSPWVYKAWYTETYRNNSDKCGRSNAWLSPQEMADIVNAAIALKTEGIDISRITPVTTSCWGGNPYSMDELKNLVAGKGGISLATSVSVSQGEGTTNNVTINGVTLSGTEFKKAFNLRAPGRLSIPQKGFAFYNIEKK